MYLQSLAPTNPHWACVMGHGLFSLCVIHKEGLCPRSGGINRLMINDYDYLFITYDGLSVFSSSGFNKYICLFNLDGLKIDDSLHLQFSSYLHR
jgi:hypothetical protein